MGKGKCRAIHAAVITAAAGLLALLISAPAEAQGTPDPLKGDASWVWYVSESGGSGEAIAKEAEHHDLDAVFVKSGDGSDYWSQFTPDLVDAIHAKGIDVCAWQFVYGNSPAKEAAIGARAVYAGADCLIIDAEGDYEGKYASADTYITKLRKKIGADYPLVLASFPYVDYHPAFPFSVFLGPGGAQYNAPQLYWYDIGTTVLSGYTHTFTFNRPYDRPIYPVGQTYNNPPRKQLEDFRRYANAFGAPGISWWSWQETSNSEWRTTVSSPAGKPPSSFQPQESYPQLELDDSGDLVVWAQELLSGAGYQVPINGRLNSRTRSAVIDFQKSEGLPANGTITDRTWESLLQNKPERVHWAKGGMREPGSHGRSAALPTAPASAGLPPVRDEIPAPPTR